MKIVQWPASAVIAVSRQQFGVFSELLMDLRHARGQLPHTFELLLQALVHSHQLLLRPVPSVCHLPRP